MTDNEAELLAALNASNTSRAVDDGPGLPPLALGGSSGSHHAVTLARMVPKGWVERFERGGGRSRPAWRYRITAKGAQALDNHRSTQALLKIVRKGSLGPVHLDGGMRPDATFETEVGPDGVRRVVG